MGRRRWNSPAGRAAAICLAFVAAMPGHGAAVGRAVADTGGCVVSLTVVTTIAGKRALDFRCRCGCARVGDSGVAVLRQAIEDEFGAAGPPAEITQLFIGRIEVQLPEAAEAMSFAASGDADWDAKRAWSNSGYANAYVHDLLDGPGSRILDGLRALFARWNIAVDVASVEKVLMAVPADLPYGAALLAAGAEPGRRLPFDAVVWLHLTRGVE